MKLVKTCGMYLFIGELKGQKGTLFGETGNRKSLENHFKNPHPNKRMNSTLLPRFGEVVYRSFCHLKIVNDVVQVDREL